MAVERDPEDVKEFLIEGSAFLDDLEPALAQIRSGGSGVPDADAISAMFRAFHSIKGVSGFLSFLDVQESTHKAEEALDMVRTGKLALDPALAEVLLEACDLLRRFFAAIEATGEDLGLSAPKEALIARLLAFTSRDKDVPAAPVPGGGWSKRDGFLFDFLMAGDAPARAAAAAVSLIEAMELKLFELLDFPTRVSVFEEAAEMGTRLRLNAEAFGFSEAAALSVELVQALQRPRPAGTVVDAEENTLNFRALGLLKTLFRLPEPEAADLNAAGIMAKELVESRRESGQKKSAAEKAPANEPEGAPGPSGSAAGKKGDIRVSLDKLDKMVDLIEELGVAASAMSFGVESGDSDGEFDVRKSANKLRQVTEELQEVAMSVRMVPLSTSFRKMVRLVGDVSAKLGKKARLEITGEETEVDKDAAEALQDPLVHLLRNCLDHGLEMPDQRTAAGKAETGVVRLQAWYSGGEACISISDDGRGIDRDKVLAKAVSQGLATEGAELSDPEVFAFIFHPGFSLAKQVTEFSGRGVGMDVVKRNIEKLKGKVEIASEAGKGSTFLVRIPMANALTESMLVRAGESRYVIRVSSIRETFRPENGSLTRLPNGDDLIRLRGELHPVVRLRAAPAGTGDGKDAYEGGLMVLVENHGRQLALFVDEVLGKIQSVVKAPPELLKSSPTLAGYSIIGTRTDDVAWSLDIDALAAKAGL